jgi:carboxymethylenebutenolidase
MPAVRVRRIEIGGQGGPMPATLGVPDAYPPGPAVVVVQEWWGLNGHIESFVDRFAAIGFAALAPDLYRGEVATEPDNAKKARMKMDDVRAVGDLKGAVSFLVNQGASAVGIIGFCMGGWLTWETALEDDRLSAAVAFYGMADDKGRELRCPLQAHFGTEDHVEPAQIEAAAAALASRDDGSELFLYEGAPHAFMNDTRESYRPEAASLAWERTIAFFTDKLGAPLPV